MVGVVEVEAVVVHVTLVEMGRGIPGGRVVLERSRAPGSWAGRAIPRVKVGVLALVRPGHTRMMRRGSQGGDLSQSS